jgi:REP element-mobilizing transposase RayT
VVVPIVPPTDGSDGVSRKRTRWALHDYATRGSYFVTFCTDGRRRILGDVLAGVFVPSAIGGCVEEVAGRLAETFPDVEILVLQVMPDHVHAIVRLRQGGTNLSAVIRRWKAETVRIVRERDLHRDRLWQRGFNDRVLRDDQELYDAERYIRENPRAWWQAQVDRRKALNGDGPAAPCGD